MNLILRPVFASLILAAGCSLAFGQLNVPSNEYDGVLNLNGGSNLIDLSLAESGNWDKDPGQRSGAHGAGIYDPARWAVVFHYTSVNLNTDLYFKNHPSGAPVIWLVKGDVNITGSLSLNPNTPVGGPYTAGPGGFRGGHRIVGPNDRSGGNGPGGGDYLGGGGSFGSAGSGASGPTYGDPTLVPLIGGSGSSGDNTGRAGMGGSGAILIVAQGKVTIRGVIYAHAYSDDGYKWYPSGGAIRIVATDFDGTGTLTASKNGSGGAGRIRIEVANSSTFSGTTIPATIPVQVSSLTLFPPDDAPTCQVIEASGVTLPADFDPRPLREFPPDVSVSNLGQATFKIRTRHLPVTGPNAWKVELHVVPISGPSIRQTATLVSGDDTEAIWEVVIATLPSGTMSVQARAYNPN